MSMTTQVGHTLGEATIAELRGTIEGSLSIPDDPDFDQARKVWNDVIDRRPALVLRCTGVADVIAGVSFARSEGLPIAVRGGAHSIAGFSTCDGGVVLDLGSMNAVHVDPQAQRARVQGGALWKHIDRESQVYGLATTGGLVSSTGVGGFALGGGIGHLARKYGLTCDNLLSAEMVTADGQLVRADENENSDLSWGLRGGSSNFGVVTSMELAMHPVGPVVMGGVIFYPGEQAAQVLRGWREAVAGTPDELTTVANLTSAPPLPVLPEKVHGQKVAAVLACWAGPHDEGEQVLAPLRALGEPITDLLGPIPYVALQQLLDPLWTRGASNYFTSAFLDELPDAAVDIYAGAHRQAEGPPALCELHVHQLGGAVGRVPAGATAFAERGAPYVINCIARTPAGVDPAPTFAWARDTRSAMAGYGSGSMYVNFTPEGGEQPARASYPAETYRRLAELKRRYDPDNTFRFNQNVLPANG
ncbi:MAG: FAD-binding oxidoreductase [Dermatophilaceae bacterium]